jgi:hypothetical protein
LKPNIQRCPICAKPVEPSQRYPHYVCHDCAIKASSQDGRALEFHNENIWGGFVGKYADTGVQYLSHDCYIDGIKCYADEARFGGIVIQVVSTYYKEDLYKGYWEYRNSHFSNEQRYFDRPSPSDVRPPVFIPSESWRNIIINPAANHQEIHDLLALVPEGERHKWFRSMSSSQALTQSILGNLKIFNAMHILSELKDEDDEELDLFGNVHISANMFRMEYKVDYLGEPRPTSLDGYILGDYQIAIECKLSETEFGTCSRPRLKRTESEYCDGKFTIKPPRTERCPLTQRGIQYWKYVAILFNWKNDCDKIPCPLNKNYQLVRNILAAGVKDRTSSSKNGHAVIIYDKRNPAFQFDGEGENAYLETKRALKEPTMLRKCNWQSIVQLMREKEILPWLTENLKLKYGL